MATQTSSKPLNLQKVFTDAARLEIKALHAGVECVQVWIHQAAKLSHIASETLSAIQEDKGSFSETARRLAEFGKDNAEVFGDLSSRLTKTYYDELGRLSESLDPPHHKPEASKGKHPPPAPVKKPTRRKPAAKKTARAKG
ncbi:MAG: hypothetical protein ABSF50_19560 [Burkholderiaceae bacterium]